ncbi:hypothetical protein N9V65_04975, partial [Flavobacteriales bacterium]|nr:hypothetical protein [Flavobacteriales bacterium]
GNCLQGVAVVYTPGSYAIENSFTIADCDGNVVAEMYSGADGFNECVVLPETYTVTLEDSYGDGWNQGSLTIGDDVYTILDVNGESTTNVFTTFPEGLFQLNNMGCPIGCTNPLANNYDAANVIDDGSCVFCIDGEEVSELPEATLPDDIITITIATGSQWSSEISWELYNDETEEFIISSTQTYANNETYVKTTGCLPAACYKLVTYDDWGDGWNGNGTFTVTNQFGEILVPSTVMGPNSGINTEAEMGNGYADPIQELSTYFSIGDASCNTFGCTDPAASNYDADASVDDGSCITCPDGEVDVTFSFNQENILTDEVFVYNETDTVFSVVSNELSFWEGKTELMCVPAGCYTISMGASSSEGWTDGSQLQILDDLSADYYFLDVGDGSINYSVVSIGGGACVDTNVGGCTDEAYDNYNPDATYDNGSCEFLCTSATEGAVASVEEDAETAPWSFLCSDASGNGAVVTFEELNADMIYVVADCDSAEVYSFNPNFEEVVLSAGDCIYFQAVDAFSTDLVGTITASLFELPDTSLWGCMDEYACNYDELATYEPADACVYPVSGFDCDSVELADYMDVELDFTGSFNLCLDDDDYNATDVSDYPGFTWNTDGEDMAFAFAGDGNQVLASVYGYSDLTFNDGHLVIYNGNPLDGGTLVDSETYSGTEDMEFDIIFDTEDGNTYFVIVDSDNFDDCFEFDISITSLIGVGGCTDSAACNFDELADFNDLTCFYAAEGFDCENNFLASDCGFDNVITDSIAGPYSNNMLETYIYPSDGVTPVTIVFTSGETESCCDEWSIYDGTGDDAVSPDNLIAEFAGDLAFNYATGLGNGITVVFDSDISVTRDDDMVFDVYCVPQDLVGGCIDSTACNYDAEANYDDGSCFFASEGFDCDNNFLASDCGFDNITTDSIAGPYENNMYEVFTYASDGETPVTVVFTAGETETNWDYWYVYDGIGDAAISIDNQIAVFDGDLAFSYATGSGNGITVVFDSDGSVTRNDDMVFDVYCVAQDVVGGCIDSTACNYDADADYNDGTCFYPTELVDCNGDCFEGETFTISLFDAFGDGWASIGGQHELYVDGQTFTIESGFEATFTTCLADICHEIYFISGGVWANECTYSISDADGNVIYSSDFITTIDNPGSFGDECGTFGCTDPS